MAASQTKTSTPRLSEAARHVVIPSGIVTTGWSSVKAKGAELGIFFDEWQDGTGRIALGKRSDGKYAATIGGVVLSIPRQVGKTFLVGSIVFILCVLFPGLTVIWTAHRTRTTTNTFRSLQGMARRKKIAPHIARNGIRTANGEQEIRFRNGSAILFGAREQGFGRGFDEVDIEVFDEAQILTEKALEDMVAATNQSRFPAGALLFFMGTPPRPVDPGEEFTNRRSKALSGKSQDMVYVEFSADHGCDPDDRQQWAKANPSFPDRTPLESMLRLRENLTSEDSWMREGLGVWDTGGVRKVIPMDSWNDAGDETSLAVDRFSLGVEVGPDLAWASVGLAGQREDRNWHIELDERRDGVAWLVPYLQTLVDANPQVRGVVTDVAGPVSALLEQKSGRWFFRGTRLEVTPLKVADIGAVCSQVLDGIVTGWLHHIRQPQLTTAVAVAGKRQLGDTGKWVWARGDGTTDITPIQSVTWALWGAQSSTVKRPGRRVDSGAGRRVVTM